MARTDASLGLLTRLWRPFLLGHTTRCLGGMAWDLRDEGGCTGKIYQQMACINGPGW